MVLEGTPVDGQPRPGVRSPDASSSPSSSSAATIPDAAAGRSYSPAPPPPASGVVLLGDAIHAFPPDLGQGVNSALQDVVVLGQALQDSQDRLEVGRGGVPGWVPMCGHSH